MRAEANETKAETEASKNNQVAWFLKDMLKGVGPSVALGRDTTMLREILDRAAERIGQSLGKQSNLDAELRNTISQVYVALGDYKKGVTTNLNGVLT